MSQPENNTASPVAQQVAATTACQFFTTRDGEHVLSVNEGVPVDEVMRETSLLLEGLWLLLDTVHGSEDSLSYLEVGAVSFLVQSISAMQQSCRRGLAAVGGEA